MSIFWVYFIIAQIFIWMPRRPTIGYLTMVLVLQAVASAVTYMVMVR